MSNKFFTRLSPCFHTAELHMIMHILTHFISVFEVHSRLHMLDYLIQVANSRFLAGVFTIANHTVDSRV